MKVWKITLIPRILVNLALCMTVLHLYVEEKFTLTLDTGFDAFLLILFLTVAGMLLVYPVASRKLCLLILMCSAAAFGVFYLLFDKMGGSRTSLYYLFTGGFFIQTIAGLLSFLNSRPAVREAKNPEAIPAEKGTANGLPVKNTAGRERSPGRGR